MISFIKYYSLVLFLGILTSLRLYSLCGTNFDSCLHPQLNDSNIAFGSFERIFVGIRSASAEQVRRYLPSPHSELLLGMLLGIDDLKEVPTFKEALLTTGTVHVVVVSGFNISLVFGIVINIIGSPYKVKNLLLGQCITLFYALLSGFNPPVIRAWVMGSIAAWGKYCGRGLDTMRLLLVSAFLMTSINPIYMFSLSFQLSFLATASLILFNAPVSAVITKVIKSQSAIFQDLITTLAAQVLVWPLIANRFGRVSLISPLVNSLILWTVPISTILGFIFLPLGFISPMLARIASLIIYIPLDIFVSLVYIFARCPGASITYYMNSVWLLVYYCIALFLCFLSTRSKASTN